jgi:hypothetical protein
MIFDDATQLAVDNLGWVDRGSLWTYSVRDAKEERIRIADADHLRLKKGAHGLFRVISWETPRAGISIRHFRDPSAELAGLRIQNSSATFTGNDDLWGHFDSAVLIRSDTGDRLVRIDASAKKIIDLDTSWFSDNNYDTGWSSLVDCLTLPGGKFVLVSAQRSSRISIIDREQNKEIGSFTIAGRNGNPELHLLTDNDLLANDYDTMCRVDIKNRKLAASALLQSATAANVGQFIGHYYPHANGTCAVARPYNGDALLIDSHSLATIKRVSLGGQPLSICMTTDSAVITRDWANGRVAIGLFE